jgi:hypothetical protein
LRRLAENEENREKLIAISTEGGVFATVVKKFPLDRMNEEEFFVSLLFYMGLLTYDRSGGGNRLKIPNYSVSTLYWEYVLQIIRRSSPDIKPSSSELLGLVENLTKGTVAGRESLAAFMDFLRDKVISRLSNRDLEQFDEKHLKMLILACLFLTPWYLPRSEYEVREGYVDIYLKRPPGRTETVEWVWELKYLKVKNRKELAKVRKEAKGQLEGYVKDRELEGRADLRKAVIVFIGKDRYEIIDVEDPKES